MIINGSEQYNQLIQRMEREQYIYTPLHRDIYLHPEVNQVLCYTVTFVNGDHFTVSVTHSDAPQFLTPTNLSNQLDGQTAAYLTNQPIPEFSDKYVPYIQDTYNLFNNIKDVNKVIPLTCWNTAVSSYNTQLLQIIQQFPNITSIPPYQFIRHALTVLRTIESAGLSVDEERLNEHFGDKTSRLTADGKIYSQYNLYTTTGRPSNRFGGINFAALNKTDGSREVFNSRFDDGSLVQLDFEAYHLRLIGKYVGLNLPTQSLHTYLAEQYFGKTDITQEEYDQAKQMTFSILYGADVEIEIPLLKAIKTLSEQIYQRYPSEGLIAPISKRQIHLPDGDASQHKLFNYFVQALEFESTIGKLDRLVNALKSSRSKLVLYTYDAVLLDCHPDELDSTIELSRQILTNGGYPVRTYIGKTYDSLSHFEINV